jgi:mono/diheme cytochrome c family protein
MPPGAVPFSSPVGEALPPLQPTVQALEAYAAGPFGVNPLPAGDSAVLATGRAMYERYCFVCHGTAGTGDGPVVGPEKFPPLVTNLTLPLSVGRSDGYLYAVVRAGRGLMPPYGQRMTERERWSVVHYVRELQRQSGTAPAAAAPDTAAAAAAAADTAQGTED